MGIISRKRKINFIKSLEKALKGLGDVMVFVDHVVNNLCTKENLPIEIDCRFFSRIRYGLYDLESHLIGLQLQYYGLILRTLVEEERKREEMMRRCWERFLSIVGKIFLRKR